MAVAHVQTLSANQNGAAATTMVSPSITITGGSLVLVGLVAFDPGTGSPNASSVVFNSGAQAFTRAIGPRNSNDTDHSVEIWYLQNATGGTATVTATWPIAQVGQIYVTEVSGAATASVVDGAGASAAGSSTAAATGSYSTTNSDDFWYAVVVSEVVAAGVVTAGSGWTIPANGSQTTTGGNNVVGGVEYKANPATTSGNGQFTVASGGWGVAGIAFKAASGGGGATVTAPSTLTLLGVQ